MAAEAPLETLPVGPAVAGPRDALRAVAFYAGHPRAAVRPGRLDRALWGVAQVVQAARLLASDRALFRAALVPTVLTTLGCAAAALWVATHRDLGEGTELQAFLASFVAISSMPPTLLQRSWMRVGLEARRALGASEGELEHPDEGYVRMLVREGWKAVRQFVAVGAGLAPVYFVLLFLPGRRALIAGVAAVWAGYWILLDALEIPMELAPGKLGPGAPTWMERLLRRGGRRTRLLFFFRWGARFLSWCARPWRHEAKLTERRPWETLGFGLAAGTFLAIPVVGLFFRAVCITAATAVLVRLRPHHRSP